MPKGIIMGVITTETYITDYKNQKITVIENKNTRTIGIVQKA